MLSKKELSSLRFSNRKMQTKSTDKESGSTHRIINTKAWQMIITYEKAIIK